MRATIIHGAGDIRVETVPDPKVQQPTDVLMRVVSACICGSDLWPHGSMDASHEGERIGHEFVGVIEDLGDGAVGLSAVLAAKRLGAERIILMGRHKDRTDLGVEFGATDVVAERGAEGIERVPGAHRR